MIYFTSDPHFYHNNIIKYCSRPFDGVEEMNDTIIEKCNSRVKKNDTLFILGDFVFGNLEKADQILQKLNGDKKLILGNHDFRYDLSPLFKEDPLVYDEVTYTGTLFTLFHYPMESWRKRSRGSYHLHGHCHGTLERKERNRFDVGVDCWDFYPVSAKELLDRK